MTIPQAARQLGISESAVLARIHSGTIPATRIPGKGCNKLAFDIPASAIPRRTVRISLAQIQSACMAALARVP